MTVTTPVADPDYESLSQGIRGEVLQPDAEGYDESREVRNAMIDRQSAVIVRCAEAANVIQALEFARNHGLHLAVEGAGHNAAGNAVRDDGLVLFVMNIAPCWIEPKRDDECIEWVREAHAALIEHSTAGTYVNVITEEVGEEQFAYRENYGHLAEPKTESDPENVFRLDQNVAQPSKNTIPFT